MKFTIVKNNVETFTSEGCTKKSFLLHGVLDSASPVQTFQMAPAGGSWLRLELVMQYGDRESLESALNNLPCRDEDVEHVIFEDLAFGKRIFNETTGSNYKIKCLGVTNYQINYGDGEWNYGVWISLCFNGTQDFTVQDGDAVQAGDFHVRFEQNLESCPEITGSRVRITLNQNPTPEALFDHLGSGKAFQHEKRSSQKNSLVLFALKEIYSGFNGAAGNVLTVQYSGLDDNILKGYERVNAGFQYAGPHNELDLIHFMESYGIFKGISVPAPHHFEDRESSILKNPDFWRDNMIEIIEADFTPRSGGEHPHEVVTFVLK